MKCRFTGEDHSCGYRTGRVYSLEIVSVHPYIASSFGVYGEDQIAIRRAPSFWKFWEEEGFVPYQSMQAFENDWEIVV